MAGFFFVVEWPVHFSNRNNQILNIQLCKKEGFEILYIYHNFRNLHNNSLND